MTKQDGIQLKDEVRKALKHRRRIEQLQTQVDQLSKELIDTLQSIAGKIERTREPVLVRIANQIFHVATSETVNRAEPVNIQAAKLVA